MLCVYLMHMLVLTGFTPREVTLLPQCSEMIDRKKNFQTLDIYLEVFATNILETLLCAIVPHATDS